MSQPLQLPEFMWKSQGLRRRAVHMSRLQSFMAAPPSAFAIAGPDSRGDSMNASATIAALSANGSRAMDLAAGGGGHRAEGPTSCA
jgi:hypothetical protein